MMVVREAARLMHSDQRSLVRSYTTVSPYSTHLKAFTVTARIRLILSFTICKPLYSLILLSMQGPNLDVTEYGNISLGFSTV